MSFALPIRVYWEDTDAGGVVYYGDGQGGRVGAFDAVTGRLSGVPAAAGAFRVTVRVRDALRAVSTKTFVLSVH